MYNILIPTDAHRGPQMPTEGSNATGGHMRPQEATEGHSRPQEATGGHRRPQEATGGSRCEILNPASQGPTAEGWAELVFGLCTQIN